MINPLPVCKQFLSHIDFLVSRILQLQSNGIIDLFNTTQDNKKGHVFVFVDIPRFKLSKLDQYLSIIYNIKIGNLRCIY